MSAKKTTPDTPAVTAATMPDSYTVNSVVCIPTLKERATKARTLANQALGLLALSHLLDSEGADAQDSLRAFSGYQFDPGDSLEAAAHALQECVEELYWIVNHPDQDAIKAMRVPTEEDWRFYQKTTETGGAA